MMKQEDLFKKLGLILNELNEQYQFLAENPQQLSELELELFHANANFLTEHVQIIKKISVTQNVPLVLNPAPAEEEIEPVVIDQSVDTDEMQEECMVEELTFPNEPLIEEPIVPTTQETPPTIFSSIEEEVFKLDPSPSTFEFILNDHSEHEKFEFEEKSVDEIFNRPLSAEEEEILAQKRRIAFKSVEEPAEVEEDEIGPEPFLVVKEEVPIEKEEINEEQTKVEDIELVEAPISPVEINQVEPVEDPTYKPTLNDLLAKTRENSSFNATSTSGVKDLKSSINLNDKLLYIKDLFNGYSLAYSEAIDIANKLPNFEAADNFFQKNYAVKNNWASKQTTVDQFYALLNRRFK